MEKLSPLKAIAKHCANCIYGPGAVGFGSRLDQITNCTSKDCALYDHRPVNPAEKSARLDERLSVMSSVEMAAYHAEKDRKPAIAKERFGHG